MNGSRVSGLRTSRMEWRLRVVLHRKLGELRGDAAAKLCQQDQTEVDSGGDSASANPIGIDHHARIGGNGAERTEAFAHRPMRGRLITIQQACGSQQQRSAAYRCYVLG